jgi:hypothetical protein
MNKRTNQELIDSITSYLATGGLFNPEQCEHDKVRDLLIECREALAQPAQEPVVVARAQSEPPRVHLQDTVNGKYMCFDVGSFVLADLTEKYLNEFFKSIYTHPAPAWQGLSDDDVQNILDNSVYCEVDAKPFARDI